MIIRLSPTTRRERGGERVSFFFLSSSLLALTMRCRRAPPHRPRLPSALHPTPPSSASRAHFYTPRPPARRRGPCPWFGGKGLGREGCALAPPQELWNERRRIIFFLTERRRWAPRPRKGCRYSHLYASCITVTRRTVECPVAGKDWRTSLSSLNSPVAREGWKPLSCPPGKKEKSGRPWASTSGYITTV